MEMTPRPPPAIEEILLAEISRLTRYAIDVRAAASYRAIVPMGLLAAMDPRPLRCGLLFVTAVALILVSQRERERFAREVFTIRLVADNAVVMAVLHGVIFLVSGALGSPLLPVMVVFTFVMSAVVGEDRSIYLYLMFQGGVIALLTAVQLLGWAPAFAPAWLVMDFSVPHALTVAVFFSALVYGASRTARRTRKKFEQILARVADARSDLLDAHKSQADELTALTGSIAHELKNPLASVKGLASLLARDIPEGKSAERLGVLRREVDRMQGVLEEFLTFSRPLVPLSESVVELRALAEDVAALHEGMARDRAQRIVVEGGGTATVDPRKTRQVLINLVQNALEASPAGGVVTLRVGRGEGGLEVWVDDSGAGPDVSLGARLFEAGVTTKPQGNGLGLTIARSLARQQGGDLRLMAKEGGGARAILQLPVGGAA